MGSLVGTSEEAAGKLIMVVTTVDDEKEDPEALDRSINIGEEVEIVDLKTMTSRPLSMVSKDSEDITDSSDSGRPHSTLSVDKSSLLGTATGDNSLMDNTSRPESSMTEKDSRRSSIFSSKDIPLSESGDLKGKMSRPSSGASA